MKLQTQISISKERATIDYSSKVLLMGSCFTENIGEKLSYYKFDVLVNPFGILFHPVAIEKIITRAINRDFFTEADIFYHNEQWHCFEVHSVLDASDKDEFLSDLNTRLKQLSNYIQIASHIVFTYGTAWVYREIASDTIVANCHKIPQKKFLKELLTVEEVSASIENTIALLKSENPSVQSIHTISPVRHLKDGFIENTQSKAHLIVGVHGVIEPRNTTYYFPSYEIMMDELRDYRFYKEDMLHPNTTAINYIWKKFKEGWVASETESIQKEIEAIQTGLQHRPFNPESQAHLEFLESLQRKIITLQAKFPHLKF
ncbi:GSCFA domain-containing protein [Jejudonia soesokkakensis]|uniref:GSCFA domain-containing protein n=1 Tax=Jejudonia soesokkakensis TaxID=1323432 RepID=A0ABW2MSU3_9FLAO